jgi:hypothetical protein
MLHVQAAGAAAEVHVEGDVAAAKARQVAGDGDRLGCAGLPNKQAWVPDTNEGIQQPRHPAVAATM